MTEVHKYPSLSRQRFEEGEYCLTPLRFEDIYLIKTWRNEQIKILRQSRPLTDEDQNRYYLEVVEPTFSQLQPPQMLFSYLLKDQCIGYGGLVYLNWEAKRAEVSFLLDTQRDQNPDTLVREFGLYLTLIKRIAFDELGLHRLYTEAFDIRPLHIQVIESAGFCLEGRLREHNFIDGHYVDSLIHGAVCHRRQPEGD